MKPLSSLPRWARVLLIALATLLAILLLMPYLPDELVLALLIGVPALVMLRGLKWLMGDYAGRR